MPEHIVKVEHLRAKETVGTLLECLRYAGIIGNLQHNYTGIEDSSGYYSFDIYAPKDVHSKNWADMNSKRIRSFMIKAKSELFL